MKTTGLQGENIPTMLASTKVVLRSPTPTLHPRGKHKRNVFASKSEGQLWWPSNILRCRARSVSKTCLLPKGAVGVDGFKIFMFLLYQVTLYISVFRLQSPFAAFFFNFLAISRGGDEKGEATLIRDDCRVRRLSEQNLQ